MDQPSTLTRAPDVDRTLTYPCDPWGRRPRGRCRLRAWHSERVALVSELDDNTGASVTNACEYLVAEVRAVLDDGGYELVEHYHRTGLLDDRFARIHCGPSGIPTWSPLTPELQWLREVV